VSNKSESVKVTYAFIDSQNLNLGVKSLGWALDFRKFRTLLREKYKVEKAFLFIGHVLGNEKLYTNLREANYILIFKPTLNFKKGTGHTIKGNVDAELVMHTMLQWKNFDQAVIVSGDGDFYCLIEKLEDSGKLYKIIVPNKKYSSLLRKFAEKVVQISLFKGKVKK